MEAKEASPSDARVDTFGVELPARQAPPSIWSGTEEASPSSDRTVEVRHESTRYEILGSLGTGGMAEVLLARRVGSTGVEREVALKRLKTGLELDEAARRTLLHEAQLAVRVRHPNIVEAYDLVVAGERQYLELEYIEGVSLTDVLKAVRRGKTRVTEGFACYVAASIADGLQHAHALGGGDGQPYGIVHRDVKPGNIMIAVSGAVKLLDFGIARAAMEGRDRTQTGTLKGTYAYLSPEQAAMTAVDGRSDLFSLGIVFLELLSGVRVFEGRNDLETMEKIRECRAADVRVVTRDLPGKLQEICDRALAKKPANRFQDGAQYSAALRGYLQERGVAYWPSDCVAEARGLGVFARPADERGSTGTGSPRTGPVVAVEERRARPGRSAGRAWAITVSILLVVALLGALALWSAYKRRGASPEAVVQVAVPSVGAPAEKPEKREASVGEEARDERAVTRVALPAGDIVRPKTRKRTARPILAQKQAEPARAEQGAAEPRIVWSGNLALARGTLVQAKLVQPIDATRPGAAEAVVTDDVVIAGAVRVPKGSAMACLSRTVKDERVGVSCESIKTADRVLSFSGLAVGQGQHIGLRVLDTVVPAGTPFVVYVLR